MRPRTETTIEKQSCCCDEYKHMPVEVLLSLNTVHCCRNAMWKTLHKEKAIHISMLLSSLGLFSGQMYGKTVEMWVWKSGVCFLEKHKLSKTNEKHPGCYQWKVQKPACGMLWKCIGTFLRTSTVKIFHSFKLDLIIRDNCVIGMNIYHICNIISWTKTMQEEQQTFLNSLTIYQQTTPWMMADATTVS